MNKEVEMYVDVSVGKVENGLKTLLERVGVDAKQSIRIIDQELRAKGYRLECVSPINSPREQWFRVIDFIKGGVVADFTVQWKYML